MTPMDEEAALLRAIQANPSDATAKLAYADWLDERGSADRARYVRLVPDDSGSGAQQRYELERHLSRTWVDLFLGRVPVWDPVTMLALGRLQGLLGGFAQLSAHESDISYDFDAHLFPLAVPVSEAVRGHFGPRCEPVAVERMTDWEDEFRALLNDWLFVELRRLSNGLHHRLAVLTNRGREWILGDIISHVRAVVTPTTGWRVRVTPSGFYAIDWADVALESADRVLFLHFSFTD